jgi:N utilization substance protein B
MMLARNVEEFGGEETDRPFMETLLKGVLAKRETSTSSSPRQRRTGRSIRSRRWTATSCASGFSSSLFADRAQVPAKVAINEAIELAKVFGGDSSGRFVNGVLGAVYKELGEPGKDEKGKKERVKREDLPLEKLGGAIVYAEHEGQYYLALVHDVFGRWTLSKGHIESDPTPVEEGVKRVVKEELGSST